MPANVDCTHKRAVGAQGLDLPAFGGVRIAQAGDVGAGGELMSAVPVARSSDHAAHRLQAAAALMQALEEIAARAVDEQDVGLRRLAA